MGCSSTSSPSRNGAIGSRSGGITKRTPPNGSGGSIKRVKPDDPLAHNHCADLARRGGNNKLATKISPMGVGGEGEKSNGEVANCPRIYLSLSKKEKEDDFYAMKGTKLPHRPKKRPKAVDRALQYIYPGLWLSDLTRARYEVRERKSTKKVKRKGGLKGLENMDSESE